MPFSPILIVLFIAVVYWMFAYSMSRVARRFEHRADAASDEPLNLLRASTELGALARRSLDQFAPDFIAFAKPLRLWRSSHRGWRSPCNR